MVKDLLAVIGLLLILIGFYVIYWPISLVIAGSFILGYSLITVYKEESKNE